MKNFVCTIKFQGETDHEAAAAFAAIPGAQVLHLHHNKHELTFMLTAAHEASRQGSRRRKAATCARKPSMNWRASADVRWAAG